MNLTQTKQFRGLNPMQTKTHDFRYFRLLPPTSASGSDAGSTLKNGGSNKGEHAKMAEVKNETA